MFLLNSAIPQEEFYFSFKLSPIVGDNGRYAGTFTQAVSTTREVVSTRRGRVLSELTQKTSLLRDLEEDSDYWRNILEALDESPNDSPFAALYRLVDGFMCEFTGGRGVAHNFPENDIDLNQTPEAFDVLPAIFWRYLHKCRASRKIVNIDFTEDELKHLKSMPYRGFGDCHSAVVLPIVTHDREVRAFLILGLNHRRPYDRDYKQWITYLDSILSSTMAKVVFLQNEITRQLESERAGMLSNRDMN